MAPTLTNDFANGGEWREIPTGSGGMSSATQEQKKNTGNTQAEAAAGNAGGSTPAQQETQAQQAPVSQEIKDLQENLQFQLDYGSPAAIAHAQALLDAAMGVSGSGGGSDGGRPHHTTHSQRPSTTGASPDGGPAGPGLDVSRPSGAGGYTAFGADGQSGLNGSGAGGSGAGGSGAGGSGGAGAPGSSSPSTSLSIEELLRQQVDPATGKPFDPSVSAEDLLAQIVQQYKLNPYALPDMPNANPERVNHVDTASLQQMLQQLANAQAQQSQQRIDYGVQQGVNELNRAMEDAAPMFQTQRDQVSADEANALDNQALYAETRGDRGGIGQAQYASIQNTAAQNRRAINDAQVKLGTDTARQISDLRSQGEFTKADQLLSITQQQLSQLMNLEQWAMGQNVSIDEFNSQLQQWADEFNLKRQQILSDLDLSAAQLTGVFSDGTPTLAAQQQLNKSLTTSGQALLEAGVMPSRQQLEAMGLTEAQARVMLERGQYDEEQLGLSKAQSGLASVGSQLLNAGIMPSRQQLEAMGLTETQAKAYLAKINA